MNLLLLTEDDHRADDLYVVTGPRARHVREVLRAAPGDTLRVGLLGGGIGSGEIRSLDGTTVTLACVIGAAPPRPRTDLVLAIPRPKMLTRLLPQIAALGVDRLVLLRTWRVGKPYLTARVLTEAAMRPLLLEGLMQARGTHLPRVTIEPLFRPFAEDRAPRLADGALALAAHPGATESLAGVRPAAEQRVVLAVGPEGGLLPFEVDLLATAGFRPVSMGTRTLRTDTATVALLSQVALLRTLA